MTGRHRATRRTRQCPVCNRMVASTTGALDLADPHNLIEGHNDNAGRKCPGSQQQFGITVDTKYGRLRP